MIPLPRLTWDQRRFRFRARAETRLWVGINTSDVKWCVGFPVILALLTLWNTYNCAGEVLRARPILKSSQADVYIHGRPKGRSKCQVERNLCKRWARCFIECGKNRRESPCDIWNATVFLGHRIRFARDHSVYVLDGEGDERSRRIESAVVVTWSAIVYYQQPTSSVSLCSTAQYLTSTVCWSTEWQEANIIS